MDLFKPPLRCDICQQYISWRYTIVFNNDLVESLFISV